MSDESTLNQGGSEALPEVPATVPKSDAEAAQQQAESTKPDDAAKKAETDKAERTKNRTSEYIAKINRERAELAAKVARLESQGTTTASQASQTDKEPSLDDFDFDVASFNKAHAKWAVADAVRQQNESAKQADEGKHQQEVVAKYEERLATFADEHPDFQVIVGSIPYQLCDALQAAIMAHERGPEIAYHLGNNDDDAFAMASVQPSLAAAAVDRLAKRLSAAPAKTESDQPVNQLAQAPAIPPKPITRAPQPTPTVSGRAASETPSEKLTDDEWYRRDVERRRKR